MLLVLLGWRGSGKDTFANYIVNNYKFRKYAFADSVKDISSDLYNVPRNLFDDPIKKNEKLSDPDLFQYSPRDICIHVGQSIKKIDPQIWIKRILEKININKLNVITDCRFPNELETVKNKFPHCKSIWIDRFDSIPNECVNETSENSLNKKDAEFSIKNKDCIETFHGSIDSFLSQFNLIKCDTDSSESESEYDSESSYDSGSGSGSSSYETESSSEDISDNYISNKSKTMEELKEKYPDYIKFIDSLDISYPRLFIPLNQTIYVDRYGITDIDSCTSWCRDPYEYRCIVTKNKEKIFDIYIDIPIGYEDYGEFKIIVNFDYDEIDPSNNELVYLDESLSKKELQIILDLIKTFHSNEKYIHSYGHEAKYTDTLGTDIIDHIKNQIKHDLKFEFN